VSPLWALPVGVVVIGLVVTVVVLLDATRAATALRQELARLDDLRWPGSLQAPPDHR
jgi:cytochrome c-type biogenesis protein CcmH/NrfF